MSRSTAVPLLFGALALAGCGKDILAAYDLEVRVLGNASPVSVTMEWPGGTEVIMLATDAAGAFQSQLGVGSNVTLRGPAECHFRNGASSLSLSTSTEVTEVTLACPGVLDVSTLGLSMPLAVRRDGARFTVGLPALIADANPIITVSPTMRYPGTKLTVNDTGGGKGDLVADKLKLGANTLLVELADYGLELEYTVQLERATAAKERHRLPGATANASFGAAVAAFGNRVAVGEPGAAFGRAYVYRAETTTAGTAWVLEDTLEPPAAAGVGSGFGEAIAMSADRIAVGAPRDGVATDNGAVYVFSRAGNDWSLSRTLTAPVGGGRFGAALALSPTGLLVIGAPGQSYGQPNNGAAYAYANLDTSGYVELSANHRDLDDEFGSAIAILDTTIYVGVPGDDSAAMSSALPPGTDDAGAVDSGAVYAMTLSGATFSIVRYLKQGARMAGSRFGAHLGGHGAALAISRAQPAWGLDCFGAGLTPRGTITINHPISAIAVHSDRVGVAHRVAGSGAELRISAYRLQVDGSNPATLSPAVAAAGTAAGDGFGRSLAFGGDVLHVGAPLQGGTAAGATYVFE